MENVCKTLAAISVLQPALPELLDHLLHFLCRHLTEVLQNKVTLSLQADTTRQDTHQSKNDTCDAVHLPSLRHSRNHPASQASLVCRRTSSASPLM